MSYSIIYGRQFVKTTKGIIPMILSGSNNCTEFIQGREVLERNWYPMTLSNKDKRIAIPAEELLERARAISTGDGADYEFAKQGGKWLYCKDVLKWVESGIRNAMNIERINFFRPNTPLYGRIVVWRGDKRETVHNCYCKTTQELEAFAEEMESAWKVYKAFTAEGFPLDNAVKAPDVIVGGPSCKPFSNANRHTRLEDHPDSDLLMQYMRIVETLNPKVFAIENVPEVLTACGGSYYAAVREKAESFGYELDSGIVQDCKVGGYTTRKRAVILGSRIGTPKLADITLAGKYRTAGDAISKVDKSWSNYSDVTKPSSEVEKRMSFVPQGGNYTSIPEEYRTESKNRHSCTYRRLAWNEPSPTIVNWRKPPLIHPLENRTLTVAEAKALQGLPKDFRICGTLGQMQQQVGNSVPVAIGEFIKRCILRILQAQRQVQFA